MAKGPAPKPTKLKVLAGNPGKRPINPAEPAPPAPARPPYAPGHLTAEAKREWRRIVKVLLGLGLYTEADRAGLAMYAQAWGRWVEAERQLKRTGGPILKSDRGGLYQNPWLAVANKAQEQARRLLSEFGLSPAQRSRLVIDKPQVDPLTEYLARGKQVANK